MSRAFDCANRQVLFDHLRDLGTPRNLLQLISCWHNNTHYHVQFQNTSSSVLVGKGLRQGCKIAPQLWVVYMDKCLRLLEPRTGLQWIMECITIYADDVHVGCQFTSSHAFQLHRQNIGHVMDVLEQLDLQLSYQKSFILLKYAGTNPRPTLKGRIQRTGTLHSLIVQRPNGQTSDLPIRNKGSYLGAVISYHAFELQSWQHRKQTAWIAFNRLRSWLIDRQIVVHKRLYLWKQCVFTVLTYSILATNVTAFILHDFQATIYRMVRIILGDHSYSTHRSHQQVFRQYHLDHPLDMLSALVASLQQRLQRRADDLSPMDFLHHVDWTSLPGISRLIACIRASDVEVPISRQPSAPVRTQALLTCATCEFVTTSVANLRRHLTTHHGLRTYRTNATDPATRAFKGAPQCSHCFQVFTTWNSFYTHIQRDCCRQWLNLP